METIDKLTDNTTPMYRIPAIFESYGELVVAESTRRGGVSPAPYASLNLGLNTADDPACVAENRRRFFAALGISPHQIASSHQIHGDRVLPVTEPGRYEGFDALITNLPDLYVTVTVADCVPILIYDPVHRVSAAVHAGWRGTVAHIAGKTLDSMQSTYETRPADCVAYVGTCIDVCSFEVGAEVAEAFDSAHRQYDAVRRTFHVDLKAANREQLIRAGVPPGQIAVSPYSTVLHNDDYYSYRRESGRREPGRRESGQTGRMLALIGFRSSDH